MALFDDLNSLADLDRVLVKRGERESDTLEYKAASVKLTANDKDGIAKDISAFANANGGLIVYGIVTDPKDKTLPIKLEPILSENAEYLMHVVDLAIRHPIPGLRFKTLPAIAPQAFLIDVPQSPLAPHQVIGDNRYYRRQGVKNVPMTHDLVELYFGRRMHAKLEPFIEVNDQRGGDDRVSCDVSLGLVNRGGQIGRDVLLRLIFPPGRARMSGFNTQIQTRPYSMPALPEGEAEAFQLFDELFHPGIVRTTFRFFVDASLPEVVVKAPVMLLDIYAADSRPYRYRIHLDGELPGPVIKVVWKAEDVPPI
jgi:hypothetical protein